MLLNTKIKWNGNLHWNGGCGAICVQCWYRPIRQKDVLIVCAPQIRSGDNEFIFYCCSFSWLNGRELQRIHLNKTNRMRNPTR